MMKVGHFFHALGLAHPKVAPQLGFRTSILDETNGGVGCQRIAGWWLPQAPLWPGCQ
jgi:hypothetical protein